MLADALTKGKVPRDALLHALWFGEWSAKHVDKMQHFPLARPKMSSGSIGTKNTLCHKITAFSGEVP